MGVMLQDAGRPQGRHRTFGQVVHRLGLTATGRHQYDVPGAHDGAQALGEAVRRNGVDVAAEEARIVHSGLPGQRLDPGT